MPRQRITIRQPGLALASLVACLSVACTVRAQDSAKLKEILNNTGRLGPSASQPAAPKPLPAKRYEVDPELREAAGRLDDPDFAAREQATAKLRDRATDIGQLYILLADTQLSTEQRYRLLAIVRDRLVNAPRGAIGVQMDGLPMPGGPAEVRVANLIPGLPAERVLEIGDRITAVDGRALNGSEDLISYVQNKQPGEKVMLTITRATVDERGDLIKDPNNQPVRKTMNVELTLGSADLLKENAGRFGPQQSPVERARQMEARNVADNFAPQPKNVNIQGEDRVSFGKTPPTLGRATSKIDPTVEQYWAIQSLLLDQQMIREGRKLDTPEVRDQWKRQLAALMEMSQRREVNAEDRDLLMRIAERFAELIEQPIDVRILPP